MANANSNVVDLKEYLKAHLSLSQNEVDTHIAEQRTELRRLDTDVLDLLSDTHKLKDVLPLKRDSINVEQNLVYIAGWLEDRIAEAKGEEMARRQSQLVQCEKLITKNERIKKNLADDMAQCRYVEAKEALDPIKIGGFVAGMPVAFATLTKTFFSDKPVALIAAGSAGAAVGVGLAFHRQGWELCKRAGRAILRSPQKLRSLNKDAHRSVIATTLTASMIVGSAKDIKSNFPEKATIKPKAAFVARL